MKKSLLIAIAFLGLLALTACTGVRGHDGSGRVCENHYFLGISLIELISPCNG